MSTVYLPVGLTYLLPDDGSNVTIDITGVISASGKVGPLNLKLTNSSNANTAVVSYDNSFVPGPPPPPVTYLVSANGGDGDQQTIQLYVTLDETNNTVTTGNIVSSSAGWHVMDGFVVPYTQFDGVSGDYISYQIYAVDNPDTGTGHPTQLHLAAYQIPSNAPSANAPTYNNPTKVFTIPPLTTEYVQIPTSSQTPDLTPTTLVCSGANVYVTPIQVIA